MKNTKFIKSTFKTPTSSDECINKIKDLSAKLYLYYDYPQQYDFDVVLLENLADLRTVNELEIYEESFNAVVSATKRKLIIRADLIILNEFESYRKTIVRYLNNYRKNFLLRK